MPDLPSLSADAQGLLQHACTELSQRLHAGEDCQAEALLQAFPLLASTPELALDLILTEFRVRQQLGQQPDPQDLFHRFPQWSDSLRQRLESLEPRTTNEDSARTPLIQPLTSAHAYSSATPSSALPPELGPHVVGDVLGQGGMGVVYRAHDQILDRPVALKVLRSGLFASDDEVERFYREARASARLRHPHIVPIHGMGVYQGQHCFTMPLLTGGTLTKQMPRLRQDLNAGVALLEKVARAVQAAHVQNVVHRDLKPSNILLDEQGQPHVSDFGLAKLLDAPTEATASGQVLGTPAYMAPEQAAGQSSKATPATDVWALGVILYELVTGKRPFQGQTNSETSWQVLNTDPPRPRSLRPDLCPYLQRIIIKCLEKDPASRYASGGELAEDLDRWLKGQHPLIKARPQSWLVWALRKGTRHRTVLAAALLPAVLLIALFLTLSPRTSKEERALPASAPKVLTELQDQLAAGHPVSLLGPDGAPRWSRPVMGNGGLDAQQDDSGACMLDTLHFDVVELLADPSRDRYRYSAEVRENEAHDNGHGGIFALKDSQNPPDGLEHAFAALFFSERGPMKGQVSFSLRRVREQPFFTEKSPRLSGRFDAKPGSWRALKIEVTPEHVRAYWDGKLLGQLDRPTIAKYSVDLLKLEPVNGAAPPTFPVRGGLGVLAFRSSVSFRKVRVEPLK